MTIPTLQGAEELVASSVELVTLPAVFATVKRVVDDPNSTAMELARVVSADPALTARVLKLVNSAFWGLSGQIDSLARAVSLLGMLQVHDMVLSTAVVETFDRIRPQHMNVARFWRGSVFRGLAASALARRAGLVDLGRVFTEGLMSDLGHMVLYAKVPQRAERAAQQVGGQPWKLAQAEQALIGCDYAQVGAALAELWKLPACFSASIRHQNTPQSADGYVLEASLMHVAAALAALPGGAQDNATLIAHIEPFAWNALGLGADCVPDILAEVDTNLMAMARVFGVPAAG